MNNILVNINDILDTYKSKQHGIKIFSKYKYWFPIKPSQRLAGIVADLMGDGHLQDHPKLRLDYTSKSITELERFNQEIFYLFGIKGKIRDCTTNKYNTKNLGINNKLLARILKLIGVPTGAKVFKEFSIPNWILEDKELFVRFINRLFSCEGCVDLHSKAIVINMRKSTELIENGIKFFEDIKIYLEKYFEIKTTNPFLNTRINLRKDGRKTKDIIIKIKRKDSLIKFQKYIDFDDINKKERLAQIIK